MSTFQMRETAGIDTSGEAARSATNLKPPRQRRVRAGQPEAPKEDQSAALPEASAESELRAKQSEVETLLSKVYGPFQESHPECWTQRTFLHAIGLLYRKLVLEESPEPDQLMKVIKAVGDQLVKASRRAGKTGPRSTEITSESSQAQAMEAVYANLDQMVQSIYGTSSRRVAEVDATSAPRMSADCTKLSPIVSQP